MWYRKKILFFLSAAVLLLAADAYAAEFDGYLVTIEPSAELLSDDGAPLPELDPVSVPAGVYRADSLAEVAELRQAGVLVSAEPNYLVTLDDPPFVPASADGETPQDSPVSEVQALETAQSMEAQRESPSLSETDRVLESRTSQWYHTALGMEMSSVRTVTGRGVRVGIVDSGLYAEHADFAGKRILEGGNYCVPEGDPEHRNTSDEVGHGTFIAGLILASPNNGGSEGLAPDAELVPLKCFTARTGTLAAIAAAIYAGVDDWGCDVLNLSFGVDSQSTVLYKAVRYAYSLGVVMTAAAGNLTSGTHRQGGDSVKYPAGWPEVIGVGAVDENEEVCRFSYRNASVCITAPGENIYGADISGPTAHTHGAGTSYASPMAAAAAALLLSTRRNLTPDEVMDLLKNTAWDAGERGYDIFYGYGTLHIGRLLAAAAGRLDEQISVFRSRFAGLYDSAALLWLAGYDERGAMRTIQNATTDFSTPSESARQASESAEISESVESSKSVTDSRFTAVTWKLFVLDSQTLAPRWTPAILYGP